MAFNQSAAVGESQARRLNPMTKKCASLALGLVVFAAIMLIRPADLSSSGIMCLALSMTAVVWWATGAIPPGYTAMLLMVGFVLLVEAESVTPSLVFNFWTTPTLYMAVGGYMIAYAVEQCGLGRRISLIFVGRFVKSYQGCIISCYVLHAILSILIPQPWSRSFLIMSVMKFVIQEAELEGKYAANVGLAAFAAAVPTSMILLTGDSTLNMLVSNMAGVEVSYQSWLVYMGVPGILATALTCLIQLGLSGAPAAFSLDREKLLAGAKELGGLTAKEIKVLVLLLGAVVLWMTDSITGINPGWVALLCVGAMALPFIGVLGNDAFKTIPFGTLLFVSAAVSLGAVGGATGMNSWLAELLLPSGSGGIVFFAVTAVVFCVAMHMVLGSTMTVIGIAGPAIVTYGASFGVNPLICAMLVYCAIALHWLLPFHHMNILVGNSEEGGGYNSGQVMKFGALQTVTVILCCTFGLFWWHLLGL